MKLQVCPSCRHFFGAPHHRRNWQSCCQGATRHPAASSSPPRRKSVAPWSIGHTFHRHWLQLPRSQRSLAPALLTCEPTKKWRLAIRHLSTKLDGHVGKQKLWPNAVVRLIWYVYIYIELPRGIYFSRCPKRQEFKSFWSKKVVVTPKLPLWCLSVWETPLLQLRAPLPALILEYKYREQAWLGHGTLKKNLNHVLAVPMGWHFQSTLVAKCLVSCENNWRKCRIIFRFVSIVSSIVAFWSGIAAFWSGIVASAKSVFFIVVFFKNWNFHDI